MEWYQEKKEKVDGPKIKTGGFNPEVLLYQGDYMRLPNSSFIRQFDKTHRFHAYILGDGIIELHTDLFKPHFNGITYHVASTYKCKPEKKRLLAILAEHHTPVSTRSERKLAREERKRLGFRDEVLPRDKMQDALKDL